jgi:transmembrane sensor
MMQTTDRRDEAIAWHIRLSDAAVGDADWVAFNDWLDIDPANVDAYDAVSLEDARVSELIAVVDTAVPRWYQRRSLLAVAASIALAVLIIPAILTNRNFETIQTRPGETREIAFAGSQIALNGGSRISLDRKGKRFARLESGEALFTIQHDTARPFVVEVGGATLQDVGTVFNVREVDGALDVTVAEGAVALNPNTDAVTISAGKRLQLARPKAKPVVTDVDRSSVAGWRQGRLSYQNASLADIAVDLTRMLGTKVTVAPDLASRRFTGVIRIDADRDLFFRRLEALLSVHARRSKAGWELTS